MTDLTKTYDDRAALAGVSMSIERGSRTVVLGHNGAGKSTLLEILATLRTPTTGKVCIEGFDAVTQAREARRLIGLTPQSNALDPLATPVEVLDFQGAALGMSRTDRVRRRNELLELFGLDEHRKTRTAQLSGGTRRKVDLAVALVAQPRIVILDEPTTGLDPMSRLDFWNELKRLNDDGRTLIVSTQDLHEADVLATDIVVLRQGEVAAHDTPAALKQRVGERTLILGLAGEDAARSLVRSSTAPFRPDPEDAGVVRLALSDAPDALKAALENVSEFGWAIEELRLSEPSLDDVFVALAAR
ncbi:ATP-binding cassette domain-containing protein [Nonomuraea sp. NPDC050478]|uniref:ABC transporter ATP-binding protein n=1 Tax=Nonomuraea sp. NPDC050478 TaxID=3364365 RepID=UPI0037A56159